MNWDFEDKVIFAGWCVIAVVSAIAVMWVG